MLWAGEWQIQGGEDSQDFPSCRSFSAKKTLNIDHFCGTWPIKMRDPMSLRHPVRRKVGTRDLRFSREIWAKPVNESRHACDGQITRSGVYEGWHVTGEYVMSQVNTSCHIWGGMFHMSYVPYEWVMSRIRKSHVTHIHETCHIWTRDGTYKESCHRHKRIGSHMKESCHVAICAHAAPMTRNLYTS